VFKKFVENEKSEFYAESECISSLAKRTFVSFDLVHTKSLERREENETYLLQGSASEKRVYRGSYVLLEM